MYQHTYIDTLMPVLKVLDGNYVWKTGCVHPCLLQSKLGNLFWWPSDQRKSKIPLWSNEEGNVKATRIKALLNIIFVLNL